MDDCAFHILNVLFDFGLHPRRPILDKLVVFENVVSEEIG
jgi:hypothetical protein